MPGVTIREAVAKAAARQPKAHDHKIKAKATLYVVFTCFVSAMSGALFGFDGGITGGVSAMSAFQAKFFPEQLTRESLGESYYCKYNDQILQLFATSMYFTGAVASIPGAMLSKRFGRTFTMTVAGCSFVIGSGIQAGAPRVINLILGRIFLGIGVGFADQASTIYSSEMSPPHLRGTLTMLFQLCVVTGILIAQAINVGTSHITHWGWRLSLGLSAVPGFILLVGGLLLPETPNSLIERGYLQKGRAVLEYIRGTADVDEEYGTIVFAQRREKAEGKNQFQGMVRRDLRPHLIMSIALPFFQQWTGINAVVFFSPLLFQGLGPRFMGKTGALLASVIVGSVQVFGTLVGIFMVDRIGRRKILIQSSIQTCIAELALGIVFAYSVDTSTVVLGSTPSIASIGLICMFVVAFGWGWGPLAWILTSEIQPLETRSLAQGVTVLTQLLSGGIVGQCFLSALCSMGYGVYIFFGLVQLAAALFVYYLLPETSGVPIEMVSEVFRSHWFWKRYTPVHEEGAEEKELEFILASKARRRGSMLSSRDSNTSNDYERQRIARRPVGGQGVYDSSRSIMRFSESLDSGTEGGGQNSVPCALQPVSKLAPVATEGDRAVSEDIDRSCRSPERSPANSPRISEVRRHTYPAAECECQSASISDDCDQTLRTQRIVNRFIDDPSSLPPLQPSPFANVPSNSQIWHMQGDRFNSLFLRRATSTDECGRTKSREKAI